MNELMNDDLFLSELIEDDLNDLMKIEQSCFPDPWSRQSFLNEISRNQLAYYITGWIDDVMVAYAGVWLILDEAHITNVAVLPNYRNRGIGYAIVQYILEYAKTHGATSATLEARVSNENAISLYNKMGFVGAGIRPKYYSNNGEDAIIMWKEF